jgi:hypothetical protein
VGQLGEAEMKVQNDGLELVRDAPRGAVIDATDADENDAVNVEELVDGVLG